jgi:trehalose 6-phosphate phosphatase
MPELSLVGSAGEPEQGGDVCFVPPRVVFDRIRAAGRRPALFLDFDGTLVDIVPRFDEVIVPAALPALLTRVHRRLGGALAVITGRALADVDRYLHPLAFPGCGQHGLELRYAGGRSVVAGTAVALDGLRGAVTGLPDRIPGVRVEDKGLTIALHYRERPDAEAEMQALAEGFARADDLVVRRGKAVIEVGLGDATKGKALTALMATAPFTGRIPIVFGDDLTDEHAFEAAGRFHGLAVAVGRRVAAAADLVLATARDVHAVLELVAGAEASATDSTKPDEPREKTP